MTQYLIGKYVYFSVKKKYIYSTNIFSFFFISSISFSRLSFYLHKLGTVPTYPTLYTIHCGERHYMYIVRSLLVVIHVICC
jgi:hypothetical protein